METTDLNKHIMRESGYRSYMSSQRFRNNFGVGPLFDKPTLMQDGKDCLKTDELANRLGIRALVDVHPVPKSPERLKILSSSYGSLGRPQRSNRRAERVEHSISPRAYNIPRAYVKPLIVEPPTEPPQPQFNTFKPQTKSAEPASPTEPLKAIHEVVANAKFPSSTTIQYNNENILSNLIGDKEHTLDDISIEDVDDEIPKVPEGMSMESLRINSLVTNSFDLSSKIPSKSEEMLNERETPGMGNIYKPRMPERSVSMVSRYGSPPSISPPWHPNQRQRMVSNRAVQYNDEITRITGTAAPSLHRRVSPNYELATITALRQKHGGSNERFSPGASPTDITKEERFSWKSTDSNISSRSSDYTGSLNRKVSTGMSARRLVETFSSSLTGRKQSSSFGNLIDSGHYARDTAAAKSMKRFSGPSILKRMVSRDKSVENVHKQEERLSYCSTDDSISEPNSPGYLQCREDYIAVKEDEISVNLGDTVQLICINPQNMCLVYKAADSNSPASEGWIPGNVVGKVKKPAPLTQDANGKKSWFKLRHRETPNSTKRETKHRRQRSSSRDSVRCTSEPTKPNIIKKSGDKVWLKWGPPKHGNPTAYTIEFKEKGAHIWMTAIEVCTEAKCVIGELEPGSSYKFRVCAHNECGISNSSEPSDIVTISAEIQNRLEPSAEEQNRYNWCSNFDNLYIALEEIGRGRFSYVSKCVDKTTRHEVVAKIISKQVTNKDKIVSEISIMQVLDDVLFPKFLMVCETVQSYIIIQELIRGRRLIHHVIHYHEYDFTERVAAEFIRQVLVATEYLHGSQIAHLDIKPENIIVDVTTTPYLVKFVDFGDSKHMGRGVVLQNAVGSPEFLAPEILLGKPACLNSDMWSIGVLTYVLLSGVSPFLDESPEETCIHIASIDYSYPSDYFSSISDEAREFIHELLAKESSERLDSNSAQHHHWMLSSYGKGHILDTSRLSQFLDRRSHVKEATPLPSSKFIYQTIGMTS